jgi:hypothetical protein
VIERERSNRKRWRDGAIQTRPACNPSGRPKGKKKKKVVDGMPRAPRRGSVGVQPSAAPAPPRNRRRRARARWRRGL